LHLLWGSKKAKRKMAPNVRVQERKKSTANIIKKFSLQETSLMLGKGPAALDFGLQADTISSTISQKLVTT
jgi:hypothetical protein